MLKRNNSIMLSMELYLFCIRPLIHWSHCPCMFDIMLFRPHCINLLRLSDPFIYHQPRPSLIQIMACRLFGIRPFSETMMYYCHLDPEEKPSVKFDSKFKHFHSWKCLWKFHLQNHGHFVSASVCQVSWQTCRGAQWYGTVSFFPFILLRQRLCPQ